MTGFRQIENLHAYSGGTVRDLHPVFYSPVGLLPRPQALKRNIYLPIAYHQFITLSTAISDKLSLPTVCRPGADQEIFANGKARLGKRRLDRNIALKTHQVLGIKRSLATRR